MIDLLVFAMKLSIPFLGILNNCSIPPSLITTHIPTTALFSKSFIHYSLTIIAHVHDLSWRKSLNSLAFETKSHNSELATLKD